MATFRDAIRQGIGTTVVAPAGGYAPSAPESDLDAHRRRRLAEHLEKDELDRLEEEREEEREEREIKKLERDVRRAEMMAARQRLQHDPQAGFGEALVRAQLQMTEMLTAERRASDERFEKLTERIAVLANPKEEGGVAAQVGLVKEIIGSVRDLIPQQPPTQALTAQDLVMVDRARWEREDGMAARIIEDRRRLDERELRERALDTDSERNGILGGAVAEFGKVFGPAAQELLLSRLGGGEEDKKKAEVTEATEAAARPVVAVQCPGCHLQQRHLLPEGDPFVTCPGCKADFELVFDLPAPSNGAAPENGHQDVISPA